MATGTRALTLKLLADVDNFTKNLDKADKDVATFGDKVSSSVTPKAKDVLVM